MILLIIPVYNEEEIIEDSLYKLNNYFKKEIVDDYKIIIANNGSTDKTLEKSINLSKTIKNLNVIDLKFKGRGNALKFCWMKFNADVYAYCDADLATGLSNLKKLFSEVKKGNNIVFGSRYELTSNSQRSIKRYIFSKVYICLVKLFFKTNIKDFQCGFKAIDKKTAKFILPKIKDRGWFFDTELLLTAEKNNYKLKEIPVTWNEQKSSKVNIFKTSLDYVIKIIRLKKSR